MMHAIVEGTVFTVGKTNANGWAIPDEEVENALSSLKEAVVRVCSSRDEHACDREGSRWDEIGRVIDAWREGDVVKARALITDSTAARKLKEGTWKPTWSLFGTGRVEDGTVHNLNIESLTVVRKPAYREAEFTVAAGAMADASSLEVICLDEEHTTYTKEQVDEMLAAAAEKAKAETLEHLTKEQHATAIVEAMQRTGALKAEEAEGRKEQLMEMPVDVLAMELASWQRAVDTIEAASKLDRASLADVGASGLTLGRWNNDTKQWEA